MNKLELTKEHISHIYEMCEKLFPEKDFIIEEELFQKDKSVIFYGDKGKNFYDGHLHWFEFVMLQLFPKVNQWYNTHQLSAFYYQTIGNTIGVEPNEKNTFKHPVDYLYNQFKQLKIEKN